MVGDGRLGEVEQRHQLAHAYLAGVLSQHVDELHPNRIAERLRDRCHPHRSRSLDVGIHDRVAAPLTGGSFLLWRKLEIDDHSSTYIY
jgi:hypothetical protein